MILIIMINTENINREPFIPRKINEMYRPIARNIRINYEGFYNKSSTNIYNLFRKFGII